MRQLLTQITASSLVRRGAPVVIVCLPIALGRGPRRRRRLGARSATTPTSRCARATCSRRTIRCSARGRRDRSTWRRRSTTSGRSSSTCWRRSRASRRWAAQRSVWPLSTSPPSSPSPGSCARIAGERSVLPAMCAVGLLTWTMGSEMLITPRQHQALILPYLCLLVAAWAVATGDRWAIVVAVVAASLVAQTHLSYPVLVAALAAVMVVGQVVTTRAGAGRRRDAAVGGVRCAARRAVGADPHRSVLRLRQPRARVVRVRAMPVAPV